MTNMGIMIERASEILTMRRGVGSIRDASLLIQDGTIAKVGHGIRPRSGVRVINGRGLTVVPGFVDCHSHLVFAGSRAEEFALRLAGASYESIARRGGGIASTVDRTNAASDEELFALAMTRVRRSVGQGTTTLEVKSGYGLTVDAEIRLLRVIQRVRKAAPITIIPTLLIHAVPRHITMAAYVAQVCKELIPAVAREGLAEFCDVFCDRTAFTLSASRTVLERARECGLKLKIHADELTNSGGARLAAETGCISADHLVHTDREAMRRMKAAGVVPVLLPGTSLFLRMSKKPDLEGFRQYRLPMAIASDFNPGTCLIYSMPRIIALACLQYGMTVEEAFRGATRNAARALDREREAGILMPGRAGDVVILDMDRYRSLPYQFGEDAVRYVIKKGRLIHGPTY